MTHPVRLAGFNTCILQIQAVFSFQHLLDFRWQINLMISGDCQTDDIDFTSA